MKRTTLCLFLFYLFLFSVSAQEKMKFRLGAEFGAGSSDGEINERWNIRQDLRHSSSSSFSVSNDLDFTHIGVKADFSFFKDKLSLISGLRFSSLNSGINDRKRSLRPSDYFYIRQDAQDRVDFYSVYTISQTTNYLSIPLELSFIPFRMGRFAFFGKLGSELGFKVREKTEIDFVESTMKQYEKELLNEFGVRTNSIYATLSASLGAQYQTSKGIRYNFEILLPSKQLTKNNSSIIDSDLFRGIQLSVQFPLSFTKRED